MTSHIFPLNSDLTLFSSSLSPQPPQTCRQDNEIREGEGLLTKYFKEKNMGAKKKKPKKQHWKENEKMGQKMNKKLREEEMKPSQQWGQMRKWTQESKMRIAVQVSPTPRQCSPYCRRLCWWNQASSLVNRFYGYYWCHSMAILIYWLDLLLKNSTHTYHGLKIHSWSCKVNLRAVVYGAIVQPTCLLRCSIAYMPDTLLFLSHCIWLNRTRKTPRVGREAHQWKFKLKGYQLIIPSGYTAENSRLFVDLCFRSSLFHRSFWHDFCHWTQKQWFQGPPTSLLKDCHRVFT